MRQNNVLMLGINLKWDSVLIYLVQGNIPMCLNALMLYINLSAMMLVNSMNIKLKWVRASMQVDDDDIDDYDDYHDVHDYGNGDDDDGDVQDAHIVQDDCKDNDGLLDALLVAACIASLDITANKSSCNESLIITTN